MATPHRAILWRLLGVPLAGVAVALAVPPPAPAQPDRAAARAELEEAEIILKSGRTVQGMLVRRDTAEVVVRVEGIDTPIPTRQIEAMRVLPPVRERYERMKTALEPGDVDGRLALAEWLRARGLYDEALGEVRQVLELEPFNTGARDLHRWLEAQIALEAAKQDRTRRRPEPNPEPAADPEPEAPEPEPEPTPRPGEFPTLTPDQINLMRVFEVNLEDPPRMMVDRKAITDLLQAYAGSDLVPATKADRERLLNADAPDVLELMFRLQAREFYGRVRVLEDPGSFRLFKDTVHGTGGWLTNACATARCHGGAEAGRLRLLNKRPNSDETAYTNFLILDRFRLPDGTPLIDYQRPARSPLLQMGLIREHSLYPHPEVPGRGGPGWRPVFRSTEDRQFRRAVTWIRSMYQPRVDYPVEYTPPATPGPGEPDRGEGDPESDESPGESG